MIRSFRSYATSDDCSRFDRPLPHRAQFENWKGTFGNKIEIQMFLPTKKCMI